MHAFILPSENKDIYKNYLRDWAEKTKNTLLDFYIEKITDVRELIKLTSLSFSNKTAIVITNLENASVEAQNSFLKALEEPQQNISYVLVVPTEHSLLPTIVSRCEVLRIPRSEQDVFENERKFLSASVGEKLLLISKLKKRDEAEEFINNIVKVSYIKMINDPLQAELAEQALKTLQALKANGNVTLHLTNFVIQS